MASQLFSPITLAGIELRNRIIVAPMCQYSADEGAATDWHLMHLGQYAVSGVGLIITEAVGVEMAGRISPGCLSLCSDAQEARLKRVVDFCQTFGNTKMGIQLSHAGRKGSTDLPWLGGKPIPAADPRGWATGRLRLPWTRLDLLGSRRPLSMRLLGQIVSGLRWLSCMRRMAIFCINFSPP